MPEIEIETLVFFSGGVPEPPLESSGSPLEAPLDAARDRSIRTAARMRVLYFMGANRGTNSDKSGADGNDAMINFLVEIEVVADGGELQPQREDDHKRNEEPVRRE